MKRIAAIRTALTSAIGAAFLMGACPTFATSAPPVLSAAAATPAASPSSDTALLTQAMQFSRFEIEAGQMASARATNDTVREFARTLVRDHLQAETRVKALASTRRLPIATEPAAEQKKLLTALGQQSGKAYDDAYVREAGVAQNRQAVAVLEKALATTKDADMRAIAEQGLTMVKRHLELAETLVQSGGKPPSTGTRHQGLGEPRNPVPRTTAPDASAPPAERPAQSLERGTAVPTR